MVIILTHQKVRKDRNENNFYTFRKKIFTAGRHEEGIAVRRRA
jgi:hypothetical protein